METISLVAPMGVVEAPNSQYVAMTMLRERLEVTYPPQLWDRRTGKALMEYRGHSEGVQGCVFMETSTRDTAYQEL